MTKEASPRRANAEGSNHQPRGTQKMTNDNLTPIDPAAIRSAAITLLGEQVGQGGGLP